MKMTLKKIASRRIAILGAIMSLGMIAGLNTVRTGAASTDQATIVQLVHDSQLAEQTLCLAPTGFVTLTTVRQVPASVVAASRARVASVEANLYTGDQGSGMTALLQRNCTAALTGGRSLQVAGGVGPVQCASVAVTGDQAAASCQMIKWLRSSVVSGSGKLVTVQPSALTIVNDAFVRTSSGWRITSEQIAPAPGQGP
jgi:hypothetical protein